MKSYIYPVLLLVCGTFAAQCSKSTDPAPVDPDNQNYTSYWYYNYEAMSVLNHETMGLATADEFKPRTVSDRGDTLFVANAGTGGNSLILYSKKNKRTLSTIKTWTFNNAEKKFGSLIEAIVPTNDRLYVAERNSRVHVFLLPDMQYYTCIGNGEWGSGQIFQAQAMTVTNGLIFTRSKDGYIRFFRESDVKPETYQNLKYLRQAGPGAGNSSNNDFATHYMEVDKEGHIMLTGYEAKSIRVLDPSLIGDNFKSGTNIDINDLTWSLPFKPKTFATDTVRLFATGDNDNLNVYDYEKKEWVKKFKALKGYTLSKP
ncbi:MAG: quinoprotein amine dehydrogenase, partial [Alistipes sp.]|nr:quinoprotein amine dehydrogenase [Alistipes sp.]